MRVRKRRYDPFATPTPAPAAPPPKQLLGDVKACPRCLEVRPIIPTRRICNECHRKIEHGGDRRIADGLSPLGFWDLMPEDRRRIWKVWCRILVDHTSGPEIAAIMRVTVEDLRRWYTAGEPNPDGRLVLPAIEAIVYFNELESAREPHGDETHPARVRSVPMDVEHLRALFA